MKSVFIVEYQRQRNTGSAIIQWFSNFPDQGPLHGRSQEFFRGELILGRAKFEIADTGTNEGAENKNKTLKSVNILICLKF